MGILAINKTSTTPGAPVKVYQPDGTTSPVLGSSGFQIQADVNNAEKLYIGTAGMVKGTTPATRVNVLAVLTAGQQWPQAGGLHVDPDFLYYDVDASGDGLSMGVAG